MGRTVFDRANGRTPARAWQLASLPVLSIPCSSPHSRPPRAQPPRASPCPASFARSLLSQTPRPPLLRTRKSADGAPCAAPALRLASRLCSRALPPRLTCARATAAARRPHALSARRQADTAARGAAAATLAASWQALARCARRAPASPTAHACAASSRGGGGRRRGRQPAERLEDGGGGARRVGARRVCSASLTRTRRARPGLAGGLHHHPGAEG